MCIEAVSDCSSQSNLGRPSRSRQEPAPRYRARMHTYLWLYTHPRDGRVITNDHFTEAEARRTFPDAERVEGSQVTADDVGHLGWGFSAGLVRREDGAMVPVK